MTERTEKALKEVVDMIRENAAAEIACNMLVRDTPIDIVIEDTGLSESKVHEIQKEQVQMVKLRNEIRALLHANISHLLEEEAKRSILNGE